MPLTLPLSIYSLTAQKTSSISEILLGLRDKYEAHHKLSISDEAIRASVELSRRYLPDRFLPDKAIDLMDEACARVRMECETCSPEVKELEERLASVRREKAEAISGQDYEAAASLRDVEEDFSAQLQAARKRWAEERTDELIAVKLMEFDFLKIIQ